MIKISPSILSADFCNLERDIQRVSSADYLHVDVMDGAFVPNITIGVPVLKSIRKHTDMFLDVHLMIEKPVRYIEAFAQAGADLLSVHLEADHPTQIAQALKLMGHCGVKKAVALRPITKAEAILPYLEELDLVLVMTVEPGFGGQAFMETQLDTIRQVRALIEKYNPACELEVDGGIAPKTAPLVVEAGANVLVAGSAVYGAADIPAAIQALRVEGGRGTCHAGGENSHRPQPGTGGTGHERHGPGRVADRQLHTRPVQLPRRFPGRRQLRHCFGT